MKRRSQIMVLVVVLLMVLTTGLVLAGTPEEEAQKTAQSWLNLVDTGKYAESWKAAAALLKQGMPQEKWEKEFGTQHQQFGKMLSRKLKVSEVTTKVKDIPEGEYVVIQFDTAFANKGKVRETVVTTREKNGTWRVAGYWIEKPPEKK